LWVVAVRHLGSWPLLRVLLIPAQAVGRGADGLAAILGAVGASGLTIPAPILLGGSAGRAARSAIGAPVPGTGLSSGIVRPVPATATDRRAASAPA